MIGNKYILAAALACAPLATQATETVYTFDSVTSIEHRAADILITGVLVNDATPTTVTLPWGVGEIYNRCDRVFNVVLGQPAAYQLTVATVIVMKPTMPPGSPDTPVLTFARCKSTVKP